MNSPNKARIVASLAGVSTGHIKTCENLKYTLAVSAQCGHPKAAGIVCISKLQHAGCKIPACV
jgi:hypothetical protein